MGNKHTLFIVIVIVIVVFGIYQIYDLGGKQGEPATTGEEATAFEILVDNLNTDVLLLADHDVIGLYFVHPKSGLTLYVIDGECAGDCLTKWPPYTTTEGLDQGDLGATLRVDTGEYQYTWRGQKLYTFADDKLTNDVLGDGFNGVWKIARP